MGLTSIDLRKRVVAARTEDGQSMGEIAGRFKIPKGTVQNILERYRDGRTVEPKPQNAGRKPAFSGQALRRLERDVERHPDATRTELRERSEVKVSLVAFHRALKKLGFTRKKVFTCAGAAANRCSCSARGMVRTDQAGRFPAAGFPWRKRGKDEHDAPVRAFEKGSAGR